MNRTSLKKVLCVILSAALVFNMTGCKESDKLTEIIYDQDSEEIDYDNETKVLVQDPSAEETTNQLPAVDQEEDQDEDEREEEDPEEDEEDNTDLIASEIDVSYGSGTGYSTTDTGDQEVEGISGTSEESDEGTGTQDSNEGDESSGGNSGTGDLDQGNTTGVTGARSGGDRTYYSNTGTYEEPPEGVDYVAAVGEAATIVSMLAGDADALLYTDEEWVSRDGIQEVLGDKYNDDVEVLWEYDDGAYSISDENLQVLIDDENLECVFYTSGTDMLTEDQIDELEDAGIVVSVLPNMRTATYIKEAVSWIGEIFAEGDNENEAAADLADEYIDFHDEILETASEIADTSTVDDDGEPVTSTSTQYYTLYVSDWIDEVEYVGANQQYVNLDTSNGIGVTTVGYSWSPLPYYLSVAGVYNTANDVRGKTQGSTVLVWQFNANHLRNYESDFYPTGLVSSYNHGSGNTSYGWTYLCSGGYIGVGTDQFPMVIVNSQHAQKLMEADMNADDDTNSLYKIYDEHSTTNRAATISWVGPLGVEEEGPYYAVGGLTVQQGTSETSSEDLQTQYDSYGIEVNPEGIFESWTEGTVESVLETAWISYLYYSDEYDSDNYVAQTIYDFYATFYGYSLSSDQLEEILAGPEY